MCHVNRMPLDFKSFCSLSGEVFLLRCEQERKSKRKDWYLLKKMGVGCASICEECKVHSSPPPSSTWITLHNHSRPMRTVMDVVKYEMIHFLWMQTFFFNKSSDHSSIMNYKSLKASVSESKDHNFKHSSIWRRLLSSFPYPQSII